jgi:hypothetical protein
MRFIKLLREYRERIEIRLSMPQRIQRAWRCKIAKRVLAAKVAYKELRTQAAVKLQVSAPQTAGLCSRHH